MLSNKILENDHELTYTLLKTFGCLKCLKVKSPQDEIRFGLENIIPKIVNIVDMLKQISDENDELTDLIIEKFGSILNYDGIKKLLLKLINDRRFKNKD